MCNLNDYVIENGVLTKYQGAGGDIVIHEGITKVGDYAFCNCVELTGVILPESVLSIGNSAFSGCSKLVSISFPSELKTIGKDAFYDCESLSSVVIPEKVTDIGNSAFFGCELLADDVGFVIIRNVLYDYFGGGGDIVVPEGVKVLSDYCFQRCNIIQMNSVPMNTILLPKSLTKIGNTVFEHCEGLTEVKIPDRVTEIGDFAFERNRWLTKVKLPKNLVSLGKYAFAGCSIKRITLPKSLKTIGEGALMNNNLEKIILPDEVERIDKKAFDGNWGVFSLRVKRDTPAEKAAKKYAKNGKPKIVVIE